MAKKKVPEKGSPTLTNGDLQKMADGLRMIGGLELEDFKLAYSITRNLSGIESAMKAYNKIVQTMQKKHAMCDEGGRPILIGDNDELQWPTGNAKQEYFKKFDKLSEEEVPDIKLYWLPLSKLQTEKERLDREEDTKTITANMLFLVSAVTHEDIDPLAN